MYEIRTAAIGSGFGLQLNDTCFCGSVQDLRPTVNTVAAPLQPLSLGLPGPVVNWPLSEAAQARRP